MGNNYVVETIDDLANYIKIKLIMRSVNKQTNYAMGYVREYDSKCYGIYIKRRIFKGNHLIGVAQFNVSDNQIAYLKFLAIHRKYQMNGYGSILLNNSIQNLQLNFPALHKIYVESTSFAIGFYESHNFVPCGNNGVFKEMSKTLKIRSQIK